MFFNFAKGRVLITRKETPDIVNEFKNETLVLLFKDWKANDATVDVVINEEVVASVFVTGAKALEAVFNFMKAVAV